MSMAGIDLSRFLVFLVERFFHNAYPPKADRSEEQLASRYSQLAEERDQIDG